MPRRRRKTFPLAVLIALVLVVAGGFYVRHLERTRPQDLPWTRLDLRQPIGAFTGAKLAALSGDKSLCLTRLRQADIAFTDLPPRGSAMCRAGDSLRLRSGAVALSPADVSPSCPVAAAFVVWQRRVVQPAAQRIYGKKVVRIEHFGSWNCRRIAGREAWSEHATANAIDIAAFVLEGGRRISIVKDWDDGPRQDGRFLREVRDGACRLYATTLSPDYNAAHADHFHLDQAERGAWGGSICR